jgi:hypothetical protein
MKRFLVFFMLVISVRAYTQYTYSPNTIYMIAPTSGCNGEWAVLDTMYSLGYCQLPSYSINPFSCATINHRNGDTLFFDLCSIPCNVTTTSDSGNVCLTCSVDFATNVVKEKIVTKIKIYPNPVNQWLTISVIKKSVLDEVKIEVFDLAGKLVFSDNQLLKDEFLQVNVSSIMNGVYLFKLAFSDATSDVFKVSVNR